MKKHNDKHISELLGQFKRQKPIRDKLSKQEIVMALSAIFGDAAAQYIGRVVVKNKILYINILSSTFKHQLFMSKELLLTRIKEEAPLANIDEIVLN